MLSMTTMEREPRRGYIFVKRININSVGAHFCSDDNHNLGEVTYL